jgi:hypothetical protein
MDRSKHHPAKNPSRTSSLSSKPISKLFKMYSGKKYISQLGIKSKKSLFHLSKASPKYHHPENPWAFTSVTTSTPNKMEAEYI